MSHKILGILFSCAVLPAMGDAIFDVSVTTTPIKGAVGFLAFDFLGGSPVENNTVTISGFSTDAVLGTLTPSGDATGTISPGPGTLDDGQFFNEFLQAVTYGTTITFQLDLTTNAAVSGIPDNFSFYLLDSTQAPFTTSDPTGADSMFSINVTGPALTPDVFTSSSATATVTAAGSGVPEPGAFWLVAGGFVILTGFKRALTIF